MIHMGTAIILGEEPMGKVIRVQPHLTVEEIDERLKPLHRP
jgi:hypothetical protein